MKWRALLAALVIGFLAAAQPARQARSEEEHLPRLGDIMIAKQWRHIKLWFAGKLQNWDLAAYELAQMKTSLIDAATLYRNVPVSDVTTMAKPIQSISDAIESKDTARFVAAFNELSAGCNSCHRDMGRGFIAIQVPTGSPFSNQLFAPPK